MRFFLTVAFVFTLMVIAMGSMLAVNPGADAPWYGAAALVALPIALLVGTATAREQS